MITRLLYRITVGRLADALKASLLLLSAAAAWSFHADPLEQQLLQRLEEHGKAETYEWLHSVAKTYETNPAYYDWLSRFAMEQGDYRRAIPALERLIALEGRHMGARLDLVIALQLEGRSHEAREKLIELNALLTSHDNLPEQARQQLAELNKLLTSPREDNVKRGFAGLVSVGAGHDSNANRGADSKTITVELPGWPPFEMELGPESLKTADEFAELALHLEYGERGAGCRYASCRLWIAGASTRQYASLNEYDQRQLYVGTRKTYGGRYEREYTLLLQNMVSSELEFDRIDEQNILGLEYRQHIPGFRLLGGSIKGELIDETHRNTSTSVLTTVGLNGTLRLNGNPAFNHTNRKLLWEAAASWHERPNYYAGNTQRLWLSANYPFSAFSGWHGTLGASYRWRQDKEPFSEIFFGNTRREDYELLLSAQLHRPLGERWLVSSRAMYEQVDSSIPLFDVSRFQLTFSLSYAL